MLAIVIPAYNRPGSLKRLLNSINNIKIDYQDISLIFSIDGGGGPEIVKIAKDFNWEYGEKKVIEHQENIGLKKNIFFCGDLTEEYENVAVIEDDLFVSPYLFDYISASLKYYSDHPKIAGISLYSHQYNETAQKPFQALHDGFDNFFMQLASSWGQVWTKQQWQKFRQWLADNKDINYDHLPIPYDVLLWPETSWKKHFNAYMIDNGLYFVYPRISLTTNFGDEGTHHKGGQRFQVPLQWGSAKYTFSQLDNSKSIYDAFCEYQFPDSFFLEFDISSQDLCVDLYGIKDLYKNDKKFMLSTQQTNQEKIASFGLELKPPEMNVIAHSSGDMIHLYKRMNQTETETSYDFNQKKMINGIQELEYWYKVNYHYMLRITEKMNSDILDKKIEHERMKYDKKIEQIEKEKSFLKSSWSFRIGHFILWPIRSIKKLRKKLDRNLV